MNVKPRPNTIASVAALKEDPACIRLPERAEQDVFESKKNTALSDTYGAIGLAEIEAALGRLDAGIYGLCHVCGGQISLERLEKNPVGTVCDKCD